jgi:hypothetical protein
VAIAVFMASVGCVYNTKHGGQQIKVRILAVSNRGALGVNLATQRKVILRSVVYSC